jgi:hypothetical protein
MLVPITPAARAEKRGVTRIQRDFHGGALAFAAATIRALAIGRLVIGALALKRGHVRSLAVADLLVGRLHIRELAIDREIAGRPRA